MTRFDPYAELGLPTDASPQQVKDTYRRRWNETDPSRVRGMDPRIVAAAEDARKRVDAAYRILSDPGSVPEAERRALDLPDGPPPETLPEKSYWRALWLTMLLPGSGSWYAGGRQRGLGAMAVFTVITVILLEVGRQRFHGLPQSNTGITRIMGTMNLLSEVSGWFTSLVFLMAGDALVATWAHNDELRGAASKRLPDK